jgi:hypothetical protein
MLAFVSWIAGPGARSIRAQPMKLFRRGAPSALARFAGQTKLREPSRASLTISGRTGSSLTLLAALSPLDTCEHEWIFKQNLAMAGPCERGGSVRGGLRFGVYDLNVRS